MLTGLTDPASIARALLNDGPKFAAVTMGEKGSCYAAGDFCGYAEPYSVRAVDTTGAGDVFFATFLHEYVTKEISLTLYIRSNDLGLGTPFNLTEGAALLSLFGRLTGYTPRWFTYFIGDAHVYENHLDMLNEQMKREPLAAPKLVISDRVPAFAETGKYEPEWLEKIEPSDFWLEGYEHHAPMTAPMAV